MSVNERIAKIIAEQLCVDKVCVIRVASLVDDLGADSLDLVELVMVIEEEFDCEISDEAAEKLVTVQDCYNYAAENNF